MQVTYSRPLTALMNHLLQLHIKSALQFKLTQIKGKEKKKHLQAEQKPILGGGRSAFAIFSNSCFLIAAANPQKYTLPLGDKILQRKWKNKLEIVKLQ